MLSVSSSESGTLAADEDHYSASSPLPSTAQMADFVSRGFGDLVG